MLYSSWNKCRRWISFFICICEEYSQFREMLYAKVVNVILYVMSNKEKVIYLINN